MFQPDAGLIHHSDQDSQYARKTFRKLFSDHGFQGSMSRKGDCWDTEYMIKKTDNYKLTHAGID